MSHKRRKLASGSLVVEFWASQGFLWQLGSLAQKDMEIERSAVPDLPILKIGDDVGQW